METRERLPEAVDTPEARAEPTVVKKSSRRRSITIFVVVSVLNAGLLVLLWTQLLTPARNLNQLNAADSSNLTTGDINTPLLGKPAPDFTLPALNGANGKISLADYKGKPVILNFWASWCDPCNQEAPFLAKTWPDLRAQGVVFIGIDGPEKSSAALSFIHKYGIAYPNVQDTVDGATAINYGVTGFPETVFINKEGIVVAKWIFPLTAQGLKQEMAKMMR